MSQEWSRVVSAEDKEDYMTLQGRLQDYYPITPKKLKVISSAFELDINLSQAWSSSSCIESFWGRGQ